MGRGHLAGNFGGAKISRSELSNSRENRSLAKATFALPCALSYPQPFKKLLRPRDAFTPSSSAK